MKMNELNLEMFYPIDSLQLTQIHESEETLTIHLKSITTSCDCPYCQSVSTHYHGTHRRTVQDLPILGKSVLLKLTTHEYKCLNSACSMSTFSESFGHFLNARSRMTERCQSFICALALETSGEGCARICHQMGINISGDTVIRLLLRKFSEQETFFTGDIIGIDDFAFKKGHTYGTILVDGKTHQPIDLLNGRDGTTLRKWLKQHQQVKAVTRDRATAYARVLMEELPDVMQIADRFHLHQNLLKAVKKAMHQLIPTSVKIPHEQTSDSLANDLKKKRLITLNLMNSSSIQRNTT